MTKPWNRRERGKGLQPWKLPAEVFDHLFDQVIAEGNATQSLLSAEQEFRMGSEKDLDELQPLVENAIKELAP